jgi:ribose transport system ATP-binding protein
MNNHVERTEPVFENRLLMRGIAKRFGPVTALEAVDLEVRAGEVHALIGENGAGKSTLMKVLSGVYRPDAGEMLLEGKRFLPQAPEQARAQGIAMIYQELNLARHLTVGQNITLGREARRWGVIRARSMRGAVQELLTELGHADMPIDCPLSSLGPGERQIVAIARALLGRARVIVMDEPTSALSYQSTAALFSAIARLRERGVSVIYISHFLEEVQKIADRYTVLRDGRSVGAGTIAQTTTSRLIEQMVGRTLSEIFPRVAHQPGEVILDFRAVAGDTLPKSASATLRRGEILGIAGLLGAGRSELVRALFGLASVTGGQITIAGASDRGAPPWKRLAQGMGLLSENRAEEGLAASLSIAQNTTLSRLDPCATYGVIRRRRSRELTQSWIDRLAIRCRDPEQPVANLSGGNQQKVAVARLLHHGVDILLLDEPTRGIDVASKAQIYRLVGELAAQGKAVIFVSSYIPELLGVCDRLAVMHRGKLSETRPISEWNETSVLDYAVRERGSDG